MSRLIDADEIFYDQLLNTGHTEHPLEFAVSKKRIDDMPTIESPQWIPVTERLPKKNGRYLVTRGLKACNSIWNRVYIVNYSDLMGLKAEKIWWDGNIGKSDFQRIDDVVAWMPLPTPWKGDDERRRR